MQQWLLIKESRKKPDLNSILKMVIKQKREQAKKKYHKKSKSKIIKEEEPKDLTPRGQKYQDLYQDIFNINMKILDAGNEIDTIERRALSLQKEQAH